MTPGPAAGDETCRALVKVLSHDAQGPLTSVVGFAHTLGRDDLPPEVRASSVAAIVRNARRVSVLVRNLVDAARIDAGELSVHLADADLGEIVTTALTRVAELTLDRPVERDDAGAAAVVRVDPDRLVTAVLNVVQNAVLHAAGGTVVRVRVHGATVEVADDGPGLSEEALAHACEPFWRGAEATGAGGGVGLFVARRVVELMGGRLELGRSPGPPGGALVRISLAAADG